MNYLKAFNLIFFTGEVLFECLLTDANQIKKEINLKHFNEFFPWIIFTQKF